MTESTGKVLYYLGKPDDGYGWGVANTNLVKALSSLCTLKVITTDRIRFDAPVFLPMGNIGLNPERTIKAPRIIAYGFWEMPIAVEPARINAKRYHWIFAGSEWCAERVRQATGAANVSALVQGVDFERFTPQPWTERNGFRVFIGGKWEFRKGQDIAIAAMRIFMNQRKDVVLVTSVNNPWAWTMKSMDQSWLVDNANPWEGLDEKRLVHMPPTKNEVMPQVYGQCDVGLFPNRCEAGTNLVMSEFMACERPVIATAATGQAEILRDYPLNLTQGSYDRAGWFNADVAGCLVQLERVYQDRTLLRTAGTLARQNILPHTWEGCAREIVAKAFV